MSNQRYLIVGGLVAMGLDISGKFLLTVSHSGRAVFPTENWQRVARDATPYYPEGDSALGIGPLAGQVIKILRRNEKRDRIEMQSLDGTFQLIGEADGITIS